MGLSLSLPLGLMAIHRDSRGSGLDELARMFRSGARALRRVAPFVAAWVAAGLRRRPAPVRLPRMAVLRLPRLCPAPLAALPRPGPTPHAPNAP